MTQPHEDFERAVEAACRAAFVPPISDDRREDMRNALAAAYPLLVAERDRYREALELIRDEYEAAAHMREVARKALDG